MSKMSDTTPYSTRPAGERAREADCFRRILATARPVRCVLEAFGGIGDTTAVVREVLPEAEVWAVELDPETSDTRKHRFREDPRVNSATGDSLAYPWHLIDPVAAASLPNAPVGVILDYNLSTLKRLREPGGFVQRILDALPVGRAAWVTYTDAAIAKLHLNHASYGSRDLDTYLFNLVNELRDQLEARAGGTWQLGSEAHHSRAVYIRMDRVG